MNAPVRYFDIALGDRVLQASDLNQLLHDVASGLVAAGTTRADALVLTAHVNQIGTAAASTGVVLPTIPINGSAVVINDGANSVQIYAAGSVTIDGTAGATGVALPAGARALFYGITATAVDSLTVGASNPVAGSFTTLAASGYYTNTSLGAALSAAGTTVADATQLTKQFNRLGTVAASTGAILPAAVAGRHIVVFNDGANPAKIYGAGTDTVDGAAAATGVTLTNAKRAIFYCFTAGAYESAQLGAVSA